MDKNSVWVLLNDSFNDKDDCVILHFIDGSGMLINNKPNFFNLHMSVEIKKEYDGEIITEVNHIPYSSILYIIETNVKNLNIIAKQYELVG